jgi:hypothetical protein
VTLHCDILYITSQWRVTSSLYIQTKKTWIIYVYTDKNNTTFKCTHPHNRYTYHMLHTYTATKTYNLWHSPPHISHHGDNALSITHAPKPAYPPAVQQCIRISYMAILWHTHNALAHPIRHTYNSCIHTHTHWHTQLWRHTISDTLLLMSHITMIMQ